ncbi:MAG TPA: hypothetical protein VNA30_01795 [Mycobacteriales bacterium]|nr:hypothetical protein [Mycobacteriales bacterium]
MPFELLVVLWYLCAIGGAVALVAGVANRRYRRTCLVVAASLFAIAGVLGILSIGVLFLVASALCAVGAWRTRAPLLPPSADASPTRA